MKITDFKKNERIRLPRWGYLEYIRYHHESEECFDENKELVHHIDVRDVFSDKWEKYDRVEISDVHLECKKIKFESGNSGGFMVSETRCPFHENIMVGTIPCQSCEKFIKIDSKKKYVLCEE